MRIHLIDDHPVFREGIASLVEQAFEAAHVSQAGILDQNEVLAIGGLDLLILDLLVPGFEPQRDFMALRKALPATAIVVVSMTEDRAVISEVMLKGANGFVHKSARPSQIVAALKATMEGEVVKIFPGSMTEHRDASDLRAPRLTRRQQEVLALLAEGMSNKEIARALDISHHTVRLHVSAILALIGASTRSGAAARARDLLSAQSI